MKRGLLLINLGTAKRATIFETGRFLLEFLTDKRVIDLPAPIRYGLVYCLILPFKTQRSTNAYRSIWTKLGSPLLSSSEDLTKLVQEQAGEHYKIVLGMRYGRPSIADALGELTGYEDITILPLYPHYSSAASGSAITEALRVLSRQEYIPSIRVINQFYQHPAYINAEARRIKAHLKSNEFILFSYHGIPQRQLLKTACKKICSNICPEIVENNYSCYKAQCHQTSRLLAKELNLNTDQYITTFQSRLGKTAWIKPYTDEELAALAARGVKNLSICCPSFVTDCLETLEEIGIRAKKQWIKLGGEGFNLIPSLNDDPLWVKAILEIINTI